MKTAEKLDPQIMEIPKSNLPQIKVTFFRRFLRFLKKKARYCLERISDFIIFLSKCARTEFELRNYINHRYDEFYLRRDYTKFISKILKEKLIHLDVGSRGGPIPVVNKYSDFFKVILCEPAAEEAEHLRKSGYQVIDKALYKESGTITLHETRLPFGSSIYKPQGPFLDLYNPDPDYFTLYDTIRKTTVECATMSQELLKLQTKELDFLKLDTQGSELDILMGLGDYEPLIIMTEIEYLPLYHDRPSAYKVCQYITDLGYIPFALTSAHTRTLCPTWGDGLFMPSWVEPKGIAMIQSREEKYIALMLMFGQVKILKFVNNKIALKNRDFIENLTG